MLKNNWARALGYVPDSELWDMFQTQSSGIRSRLQPEVGGEERVPLQENQTGSYPALKKILVAKRENHYNVCDGAFGDLRDLTTTMSGANLYARGRSCEATTSKKSSCKK